jgi:DNA-binding GntR family transcriptional regulator
VLIANSTPRRLRKGDSLSEHAYYVIRERILKGEIPLGAPLSRRTIAAELGMSILPVGEALQLLESEGLVESMPRVGTRVCSPTAAEIRERYEVREALESQAARLYAQSAKASDRRELGRMAEHLDAMFNRCHGEAMNDREFLFAVHTCHMEFHLHIARCTGCSALADTIEKAHVLVYNWLFDIAAKRPALPLRFHRDLIAALNCGDAELADRAMREHVRYGRDMILDTIAFDGAGERRFRRD